MNMLYILPMGWMGTTEIVLIVIIVLLMFGGKKIPELMRGLGGGIKEFKKAVNENDETSGEAKE
ncbi:MAG: twin-arginine translocase TatA/TatE family subunit [Chlorobi bacterium]|nr:twin-arginine translocase TatA/TatE family subunit [Chlorobiota bacterium]